MSMAPSARSRLYPVLLLLAGCCASQALADPCQIDKQASLLLDRRSNYRTVPARINGVDVTIGGRHRFPYLRYS